MVGGDSARHPMMDAVAQRLSRWGLVAPAIVFLELHRPFAYLAGQAAIFFQPLLGFVIGDDTVGQVAHWLSEEDGLGQLIGCLAGGEDE